MPTVLGKLYAAHDGRCQHCGCRTRRYHKSDKHYHPDRATVEHVQPKCKGGTNDTENLTLFCQRCNQEGGLALCKEIANTKRGDL